MTRTHRTITDGRTGTAMCLLLLSVGLAAACSGPGGGAGGGAGPGIADLMRARNLSEADVSAALRTYQPSGRHDEFLLFGSGGHSGQVVVIGLPSMRILKVIGVFTPEPWQGYGYGDETEAILRSGDRDGRVLNWGDTHHPALSETAGNYDGQFLFINDKANARIAVIDLEDFATKQIVFTNLMRSDHGTVVTPDTDYVIEAAQYPVPIDHEYAPIERYREDYRGVIMFWRFDRTLRRIVPDQSFAVELPPYMHDIADVGKLGSDGWVFFNSINTEMAFGGNAEGRPPLESGASQNDMDYLHVLNWRKAAEVVRAGRFETIRGTRVIRLATAIAEGLLYFVGEPKSPHGCDVAPDGDSIVVGGKLDTHATVYSFANIKRLIDNRTFDGRDPFGVPILPFREAIRGQCELGLGPLHTVFDHQGNAYTSLFLESAVVKWSLGELRVIEKITTHYNIGHLTAVEADTLNPLGRYVVAMNKWALDRFNPVGPLLPQNFQLIDISGPRMELLYDLPIPLGEPHLAQIIRADRIHALEIFRPAGRNPTTDEQDPHAVTGGQERVERRPDGVHIYMTAVRSHFTPDTLRVRQGDLVHIHITNVEQAHDATHGFAIAGYNVNLSLEPGEHSNVVFRADRPGVFPIYCTEFCSALHLEMAGYLLVEPAARPQGPAPAPRPPAPPSAPEETAPVPPFAPTH